jgi:hypothetical protein
VAVDSAVTTTAGEVVRVPAAVVVVAAADPCRRWP